MTPRDGADPLITSPSADVPNALATPSPTTHISSIASGGTLNLIGAVVGALLNFALVTILTRGLGASGAGAFFVALAVFSLLSNTFELGADTGLVRSVSAYMALGSLRDLPRLVGAAIVPVLVAGIVAAAVVWVLAVPVSRTFSSGAPEQVADLVRVFAFFLPVASAYTVVVAGTRGFGTMVPSFLIDRVGKPGLQLVIVAMVVWLGWDTSVLAVAWAAPIAIGFFAGLGALSWLHRRALRSEARGSTASRSTRRIATEFWRFTAPRGFAGMFQVAVVWINTLLIGALRSTREAGIYSAATRYLLVGTFATVAIAQVFGPKMSELIALEQRTEAHSVYQVTTAWYVSLLWPLYWTLIIFAPVLVSLFGPEFLPGADALATLGAAMLLATACGPVDVVLLMAGKSSWNLANTVFALVLNLGLALLLIPRFGLAGAAIAWGAAILANNLIPLAQTWRFLHLHPFGRGFLPAALSASASFGALGLVMRLILGPTVVALSATVVGASVVYLWLVWHFRSTLDLDTIVAVFRGRIRRAPPPA